jgi:hypothetical protein
VISLSNPNFFIRGLIYFLLITILSPPSFSIVTQGPQNAILVIYQDPGRPGRPPFGGDGDGIRVPFMQSRPGGNIFARSSGG